MADCSTCAEYYYTNFCGNCGKSLKDLDFSSLLDTKLNTKAWCLYLDPESIKANKYKKHIACAKKWCSINNIYTDRVYLDGSGPITQFSKSMVVSEKTTIRNLLELSKLDTNLSIKLYSQYDIDYVDQDNLCYNFSESDDLKKINAKIKDILEKIDAVYLISGKIYTGTELKKLYELEYNLFKMYNDDIFNSSILINTTKLYSANDKLNKLEEIRVKRETSPYQVIKLLPKREPDTMKILLTLMGAI